MRSGVTAIFIAILAIALAMLAIGITAGRALAVDGCFEYASTDPVNEPSGVMGCELYGEGVASTWGGPGVARNDCVYPWDDCMPIRITSLEPDTYGNWVEVRPTMYCDCYMRPGPNGEQPRIVDLGPDVVAALGLPGEGLWNVRVDPIVLGVPPTSLPDTAMVAP